jgi:hypothetical protein
MMESLERLAGRLLVGGLAAAAALGALAIVVGAVAWSWPAWLLAPLILTAAWIRPLETCALLLASGPLFGNRPRTPQFLWLVWLAALVACPLLVRLCTTWKREAQEVLRSGVGLAALAYAAASFLSLTSIPVDEILETFGLPFDASGVWTALRVLPTTDVLDPYYAVFTVVLTLHALVIGLALAVLLQRDGRAVRWVGGGLFAGLLSAVVVGLLDFTFVIDLRGLRAFDPYTNPDGVQRLQSTFGHSGWFAQYVCFSAASVFVLELWLRSRTLTAALGVTVLALGLLAVVLSYQRGGWITYAVVTTFIVWAGSRLLSPPASSHAAVVRLVPIAASGLVVIVSGLLVAVTLWAASEGHPRAMRIAERLRNIAHVTDRSHHIVAGLRLGALHPILGGGSETFAVLYQNEYLRAGGRYYARGYSPVLEHYGSAHNVFAQTFAGKGLVGVVTLVTLVAAAALRAWRTRRAGVTGGIDTTVGAHIVLGTLIAFVIYGQVQEVFYIQTLQLLIFAAIGLAAGLPDASPAAGRRHRWSTGLVATVLLAALAAHVTQAYVFPGRLREAYRDREISRAGARLFAPERDPDGQFFQWTGGSAFVSVPRQAARFSADLRSLAPFTQLVELRLDDRLIDRVRLDDHDWKRVDYRIGILQTLPRRLELRVEPVWQPAGEARTLGVMIRRIAWDLPPRPDAP